MRTQALENVRVLVIEFQILHFSICDGSPMISTLVYMIHIGQNLW